MPWSSLLKVVSAVIIVTTVKVYTDTAVTEGYSFVEYLLSPLKDGLTWGWMAMTAYLALGLYFGVDTAFRSFRFTTSW